MTPSHTVRRHHHPARSKNVMALLALLLSTLLLMLAARISHGESAEGLGESSSQPQPNFR